MATILVVEDDVFIRQLAELMILDWGHHVLSACDVPEALVHLRSPHHIDALFTDVGLKAEKHGGCDVAREAILLRPGLRVLYTTAIRGTDKLHAHLLRAHAFFRNRILKINSDYPLKACLPRNQFSTET